MTTLNNSESETQPLIPINKKGLSKKVVDWLFPSIQRKKNETKTRLAEKRKKGENMLKIYEQYYKKMLNKELTEKNRQNEKKYKNNEFIYQNRIKHPYRLLICDIIIDKMLETTKKIMALEIKYSDKWVANSILKDFLTNKNPDKSESDLINDIENLKQNTEVIAEFKTIMDKIKQSSIIRKDECEEKIKELKKKVYYKSQGKNVEIDLRDHTWDAVKDNPEYTDYKNIEGYERNEEYGYGYNEYMSEQNFFTRLYIDKFLDPSYIEYIEYINNINNNVILENFKNKVNELKNPKFLDPFYKKYIIEDDVILETFKDEEQVKQLIRDISDNNYDASFFNYVNNIYNWVFTKLDEIIKEYNIYIKDKSIDFNLFKNDPIELEFFKNNKFVETSKNNSVLVGGKESKCKIKSNKKRTCKTNKK